MRQALIGMFALLAMNLAAVGMAAVGSAAEPVRVEAAQPHMGTMFRIVAYATDQQVADAAIARAFERIAALDRCMSDYQSDSELMRLCHSAPHEQPVEVSEDLWRVLRQADEISRATGGAFDVTVGQLTKLWRRARRQRELPPADLRDQALQTVGFELLRIDATEPRVQLLRAGMRLDLGGIAKGFASDEAMRILRSAGITQALVDGGGGMTLGAPPPGEAGWKIGVASAVEGEPPSDFFELHDCSVATSGDLWQFVDIDGVRYSHIVHPKTGMGLTTRITATVIADDGATADALATAVCVLGAERGLEIVHQYGGRALAMTLENSDVRKIGSPDLGSHFAKP